MNFVPYHTLFLGDLSCFCQETDILNAFKQFGDIRDLRLMKAKRDGRSLGYGFITYAETYQAARAIEEMHGKMLIGRHITVRWGGKNCLKENSPSSQQSSKQKDDSPSVAEIHFNFLSQNKQIALITEETVRSIFEEFGMIKDLCIKRTVRNEEGFQSGYGFVHFPLTKEGISAAITATFVICAVEVDQVVYDCTLTHAFEKFLMKGGLQLAATNNTHTQITSNRSHRGNLTLLPPPMMKIAIPSAVAGTVDNNNTIVQQHSARSSISRSGSISPATSKEGDEASPTYRGQEGGGVVVAGGGEEEERWSFGMMSSSTYSSYEENNYHSSSCSRSASFSKQLAMM